MDLSERLGQEGVRLHELARGAIVRSLVLAQTTLRFEEEMGLEDSVEELEPLSFILGRLLDQLCARLNARSLAANSIRVRFQLDPAFENATQRLKEKLCPALPAGKKRAAKTYEKIMTLPVPMRDSKMLLKLLRLHLQSDPPAAPILKVWMAADPARPRPAQGGLFQPISPDPEKLELTVARLANLVGDSNIGSPELVDTHRPGEFRLSRFLPQRENFLRSNRRPLTAFRIFRPPMPAKVGLRDARPATVSFNTLHGYVIAASGPWRTSGDWWREDTWHHDEWDLELRFDSMPGPNARDRFSNASPAKSPQQGVYCLYFDALRQNWFVRGVYD
jgi:protein ImuB